jgi:hypothetical protein
VRRILIAVLLLVGSLEAQRAIRQNDGFKRNIVPRNDDGSGPLTPLGFNLNFFGRIRGACWVNNNGNITFDQALSTYTPFGLNGTQREIIAAFFSDVDTRGLGSELVTFGTDSVNGRPAFGANYINVGYYSSHTDKLNSFQIVIIERSDTGAGNFDIEFNYERISWETGDASGGTNGFGGVPAAVGWSNGSGQPGTSFEIEGSLVPGAFLDGSRRGLSRTRLNSTVTGRYVFRGRDGGILPPLSILTGCPLPEGFVSLPYSLQMAAAGGSSYTWSMAADPGATLPAGLTMSPSGLLSGSPQAAGNTEFELRLRAMTEDGEQTVTRRCNLNVQPPVLSIVSVCPLPQATAGEAYSRTMQVSGGRPPYRWALADGSSPLPAGLNLSAAGVISGVPTSPGTSNMTLEVRSNDADSALPATRTCALTVNPAAMAMTSSCSLPGAIVGVPYMRDFQVTGGAPPYSWAALGGLPSGLSLSSAGRLEGTPSAPFSGAIRARVTDSRGNVSEQSCALMVSTPVININVASPLPPGMTGQPYSQRLTASGGAQPYSWSALGGVPPGLTLSAEGVLAGTPGAAGVFGFRVLVTDSEGRPAAMGVGVTIARSGYSLASCPMPDATVGIDYMQRMRAEGGLEPYFFSATNSLPPGLTLNSSGLLAGRPRTEGTYNVAVSVVDATGRTTSQPCPVTVRPSPIAISGSCPLPRGRVGVPYLQRFTVTGGTPPYRFWMDGRLPAGLELAQDGSVRGTPLASGGSEFELKVADADTRSVAKACSIEVGLPDLPTLRLSGVPATVAAASAGPVVAFELAQPYSLPMEGQIIMTVEPETGSIDPAVNRADPVVRFTNGQRTVNFNIPAGGTRATASVASTGTVASLVTVRVENLKAGAVPIKTPPTPRQFRVPKATPSITDACYAPAERGVNLSVTGFSSTRQLTNVALKYSFQYFGSPVEAGEKTVDVSGIADEYFAADESVRTGGAFTLSVPIELQEPSPIGVSIVISNSQGASASRNLQRCR